MSYEEWLDEVNDWREHLHQTLDGAAVIRAIEKRIASEAEETKRTSLYCILAQEHEAQGDQVAARALYRRDQSAEGFWWYEDLQQAARREVIRAIELRMGSERDAAKRHELALMLAVEHKHQGDYAAAEAIYRQMFEADPDDPTPLIKLAEQRFHFQRQRTEAMNIIDQALEVAERTGNFRRNALAVKGRIALAMKDFGGVEDVLRRIMQIELKPGNIDTGILRDFFDRLPPGRIDPELARTFAEYCQTKRPNS